jgi:hypothetical protein
MKQSVQERLKSIDNSYQQVKSAINNELSQREYIIIEEKYHPEAFGSRYTTWSGKINAFRLVWDGKDDYFYLEVTHTLPFDWTADWKILIYIPYLRDHDLEYASMIPQKIVACLDQGGMID